MIILKKYIYRSGIFQKVKGIPIDLFVLVSFFILILGCIYILFSGHKAKVEKIRYADVIEIPTPSGDNQYGSARFMSRKEADSYFASYQIDIKKQPYKDLMEGKEPTEGFENLPKTAGIICGMEKKASGVESIKYIKNDSHLICIGSTGSGKTRHVVIQSIMSLILAGESIVVSDPKGEIYDYTSEFARKFNYKVSCLNFKDPKFSLAYNPLQPIIDAINEKDLDDAENKTWDLCQVLVGEGGKNTEKVWTNGEMAVIGASILCICYDYRNRPQYQNLSNVYFFMSEMCKEIRLSYFSTTPFTEYINTLPTAHPAKKILAVADIAPDKMKGSFFTSALTTLRLFTSKSIYNITKKSEISLSDMGDEKEILYIILPDEKTSFYQIAGLIISQQYEALVSKADKGGGSLKNRVNIVLDEFGNFAPISDIQAKLTAARSRRIRYSFFIQSYAQLEEKYGKSIARIIKGNVENTIYLWSSDSETRESISKDLGTYTTSSISSSVTTGSKSTSTQNIQRTLLNAEEIGMIDRPYQLVLTKKKPAILTSPGLENWHFNKMIGLGDVEHNIRFREEMIKRRTRTKEVNSEILVDEKSIRYWREKAFKSLVELKEGLR